MSDNVAVTRGYARTAIQKTALIVGIVFLVVGLAGFIPGLTHNMEEMDGAGADSGALLFGVFQVSILHNVVHLLFGIQMPTLLAESAVESRIPIFLKMNLKMN